jgi:hypothetical protein
VNLSVKLIYTLMLKGELPDWVDPGPHGALAAVGLHGADPLKISKYILERIGD